MARPPQELIEAAAGYVPVRVVNMAGVDLSLYTFDYDLTFAVLLMNADGTIYHRYGTRDHTSGTARLSLASLVKLLRESLHDHATYQRQPRPPAPSAKRSIEDIPTMARKLQRKKVDCFHCHMVNDSERELEREEKRFSRESVFGQWPLPEKIGLRLHPDEPEKIEAVLPGSAAAAVGIRAGDELRYLGGARIRSQMDVQWVLHNAPDEGATIPVELIREGDMVILLTLRPGKGWKRANDLEFSWRASIWPLSPKPGFGGRALTAEEREQAGLEPGAWTLKVGYIVDWGDEAYTGQNARKAGIKNGDVVVAVGGKKDFVSPTHFQSWFRFTQKPGTTVEIEVVRDGKRSTIRLPVLE